MNITTYIILNFFTYILTLKIFFFLFNSKYYFPFRYADVLSFVFNLVFFIYLSSIYLPDTYFIIFFININLFYIFFHLINMITTSPRTKIILDLKESNNQQINLSKYLKKYNCNVIVSNRIKRLKSSKQILEKNNYFYLKKGKKNFLYLISMVFSFIEKI